MFLAEKIFCLIRDTGPRRLRDAREVAGLTPVELSILLDIDNLYTVRNMLCHLERRKIIGVCGSVFTPTMQPANPHRVYRALLTEYPTQFKRAATSVTRNPNYKRAPSRNKLYRKMRRAGISRDEAAKAAGVTVRAR